MTNRHICLALALFTSAVSPNLINCRSGEADGSDQLVWPQWRGPSRDGMVAGTEWPDQLAGDKLERQWRVSLSPSYSGPIVASDRVFVTETQDRKLEIVRALDRSTGEQLWQARWEGSLSVPFFAKSNGDWIRSTPACDGERLYVAGMRDVLVCLATDSGKELWRADFVEKLDTRTPAFGFVSSPLVIGDHVFVQAGAGFVKLDKRSGEIIWRVLNDGGGMFGSAFSSPFFSTLHGRPQILVQTRANLAGVDPEDGEVLWKRKIPAFRGMNILTPTVADNTVFTSSYGGRSFLFEPTDGDDGWSLQERWTNKVQGYMSSPVVIDGHIYLHLRNQRFTCINLATGKEQWTTTPFGKYWSMVANGDKILALDQRGELLLIRADPKQFNLLDRRKVADDSWAHLAVCGDEVFVRELEAMTAYRWR
jgi:outer membrane protein assembly factor BamB